MIGFDDAPFSRTHRGDVGVRKGTLIEALDPMEPLGGVHVQRAGLTRDEAEETLRAFTRHGRVPEPIRTAHLIAGALAGGVSRGPA